LKQKIPQQASKKKNNNGSETNYKNKKIKYTQTMGKIVGCDVMLHINVFRRYK